MSHPKPTMISIIVTTEEYLSDRNLKKIRVTRCFITHSSQRKSNIHLCVLKPACSIPKLLRYSNVWVVKR